MPNLSKPHTVTLTPGNRRHLVVPLAFAGQRVRCSTNTGEVFVPIVVQADGSLVLPCAPDIDASRVYVRLADRQAA